jgi:predicted  nucleic acid-binding Zn-ribbon protein
LNKQFLIQATNIGEAERQISELVKDGKNFEQNQGNIDKELVQTQQTIKDLEARVPASIHGDLQARINNLEHRFALSIPTNLLEVRQAFDDAQVQ